MASPLVSRAKIFAVEAGAIGRNTAFSSSRTSLLQNGKASLVTTINRDKRGTGERTGKFFCLFSSPIPSTNTSSVYFISLKVGGGHGAQALALTQTCRPRQDGVQERPRPAGPQRETRERARDGRPNIATGADVFTLHGPDCLDELTMRSQGKWPVAEAAVTSTDVAAWTTKGMSPEMPRARKVSIFY